MATIIKEGQAEIVFPAGNEVFYNPIQEFNRDMSLAVINCWSEEFIEARKTAKPQRTRTRTSKKQTEDTVIGESANIFTDNAIVTDDSIKVDSEPVTDRPFTLFEGLAATGLRSFRYALELTHPVSITANDFDKHAVESLTHNINHNKLSHIITASTGDCNQILWNTIDPYGSSATFLDAAVRGISENGLLLVTCTDMAVLAGSQSEDCFSRYGGLSIHNTAFCHEMVN